MLLTEDLVGKKLSSAHMHSSESMLSIMLGLASRQENAVITRLFVLRFLLQLSAILPSEFEID